MQARELRNLSDEELVVELDDAKQELFNLRFQRESGQLEDMSRFRAVKRDVARILTIMRERELVAEIASQEEAGEQ
jgi:large subunit ribosomal protein L29